MSLQKKPPNMIEIVDDDDNVIDIQPRSIVHQQGLLHREIHVWIYNDSGKILFQHRGKNNETYPDLLDASAGGHVDPEETYEHSALRELVEEVGIQAIPATLIPIAKARHKSFDQVTQKKNNTHRMIFAYQFDSAKDSIKIESGMSQGFEWWLIKDIFSLSKEQKGKFIPSLVSSEYLQNFKHIEALL